ncbi:hypothetical protein BC832DRAFT_563277 [Gaertneriomyces semiglobifer]|nr:hypothetical protein BC832DRAFT_563277 [Gaertneriomyces semiglobifer]
MSPQMAEEHVSSTEPQACVKKPSLVEMRKAHVRVRSLPECSRVNGNFKIRGRSKSTGSNVPQMCSPNSFAASAAAVVPASQSDPTMNSDEEMDVMEAFMARVRQKRLTAAQERLRRVNRILERAQVSKIANRLKKRLEFAKFKMEHGWSMHKFEEVKKLYSITAPKTPKAVQSIVPAEGSDQPSGAVAAEPVSQHPATILPAITSTGLCEPHPNNYPILLPVPHATHAADSFSVSQPFIPGPPAFVHSPYGYYPVEGGYPTVRYRDVGHGGNTGVPLPGGNMNEQGACGWPSYFKGNDGVAYGGQFAVFPSPAPSPLASRAPSPTGVKSGDRDVEDGAKLLMMMHGRK